MAGFINYLAVATTAEKQQHRHGNACGALSDMAKAASANQ